MFKKLFGSIKQVKEIPCDKTIINYTYNKRENLIVFLNPEVVVSRLGELIFTEHGPYLRVEIMRHLVHTKKPGTTLGYLDTLLINDKRVLQSFFPLSGVVAISERKSLREQKEGQFFDNLYYRSVIDV